MDNNGTVPSVYAHKVMIGMEKNVCIHQSVMLLEQQTLVLHYPVFVLQVCIWELMEWILPDVYQMVVLTIGILASVSVQELRCGREVPA